jgi:hypothetical protein
MMILCNRIETFLKGYETKIKQVENNLNPISKFLLWLADFGCFDILAQIIFKVIENKSDWRSISTLIYTLTNLIDDKSTIYFDNIMNLVHPLLNHNKEEVLNAVETLMCTLYNKHGENAL